MTTTDPWTVPSETRSAGIGYYDGRLLLIQPLGPVEKVETSFGERDLIRCRAVVLDGDEAGFVDNDLAVFGALTGTLRGAGTSWLLGRLGRGEAKRGQNPPWELQDPTDADRRTATAWWQVNAGTLGDAPTPPHRTTTEPAPSAAVAPEEDRRARAEQLRRELAALDDAPPF